MKQSTRFLTPLLALALLALAPLATAQVTQPADDDRAQATPPTSPHEIHDEAHIAERQRDLHTRAERLDRDMADLERTIRGVRDEQRRTELQRTYDDMQRERTTLRDDLANLESQTAENFHDHHRQLTERIGEMETTTVRARLSAAENRDAYRRSLRQVLDNQRQRFDTYHQRLADLPAERRAEGAYELIQLRSAYDRLDRRYHTLARADQATFNRDRDTITRDMATFDADFQAARVRLNDPHMMGTAAVHQH
jgi:DNA repair exonuclease SbcCD ATPase subunit